MSEYVPMTFGHHGHLLTVVLPALEAVRITDQYREDSNELGPRIAHRLAALEAANWPTHGYSRGGRP